MNAAEVTRYATDNHQAGRLIEILRWPDGIVCPYCGHEKNYETKGQNPERKQWKCASCRKKFSVTTRTILEGSHIPLGRWIQAINLMCATEGGASVNDLRRELGITDRTARFLAQRVRYAIRHEPVVSLLGGLGTPVEVDRADGDV